MEIGNSKCILLASIPCVETRERVAMMRAPGKPAGSTAPFWCRLGIACFIITYFIAVSIFFARFPQSNQPFEHQPTVDARDIRTVANSSQSTHHRSHPSTQPSTRRPTSRSTVSATRLKPTQTVPTSAPLAQTAIPVSEADVSLSHCPARKTPAYADFNSNDTIDVVFTYVDHTDPAWQRQLQATMHDKTFDFHNRYRDWGELRYAMRSVLQHASWIRRVFLVVALPSQVPKWIDRHNSRIRIVLHEQLLEKQFLPTFNSLAIESVLYRIPGLSQLFLYFNNDVFLGSPLKLSDMATAHAYYRYEDWSLDLLPHPCFQLKLDPIQPMDSTNYPLLNACMKVSPFFRDRWLILKRYGLQILAWPAHTPKLWDRCVLNELDHSDLRPWLQTSRANRFRNPDSDVNIHMHYEAYLEYTSGERKSAFTRVGLHAMTHEKYFFSTFTPELIARDSTWMARFVDTIRDQKPTFVSIEDDSGKSEIPGPFSFADRRALLSEVFDKLWHTPTEWEVSP